MDRARAPSPAPAPISTSGAFEAELARRVAFKTESQQLPASLPELQRYLERGDGARLRSAWASPPASTTTRCRARGRCCSPPASRMPSCRPCSATATATSSAAWRTSGPRARVPGSPRATAIALYGRGTADNKGQHTLNMAALERVRAERGGKLGFNAKFIIEMGEEAGSKGLAELVAAHKADFAADVLIASDGPRVQPGAADHDARLPRRHQLRSRLRPARGRASLRQLGRADRQSGRDPRACAGHHRRARRASCWCPR